MFTRIAVIAKCLLGQGKLDVALSARQTDTHPSASGGAKGIVFAY